jgi:hypothetical protein
MGSVVVSVGTLCFPGGWIGAQRGGGYGGGGSVRPMQGGEKTARCLRGPVDRERGPQQVTYHAERRAGIQTLDSNSSAEKSADNRDNTHPAPN